MSKRDELRKALEKAISDVIDEYDEVSDSEVNTAMYEAVANVNRQIEASA